MPSTPSISKMWLICSLIVWLIMAQSNVAFIHRIQGRVLPCHAIARNRLFSAVGPPDECLLDDDGEVLNDCLINEGYTHNENDQVFVTKIYKANLESLRDQFESSDKANRKVEFTKPQPPPRRLLSNSTTTDPTAPTTTNKSTTSNNGLRERINSHVFNLEYCNVMTDQDIVLADCVRRPNMQPVSRAFVRAGPRARLHFDPPTVNAAIVTCGGLCPGLNNVVRELTHALYYMYGVQSVWGVRGGFHGFCRDNHHDEDYRPILLTPEKVEDIHHEGGTVLRSSRGGFDIDEILSFLERKNIHQLYVIGGDGTHRGAYAIHQACIKHKLNVAVAGIPKTIDNDVDFIDRSFGASHKNRWKSFRHGMAQKSKDLPTTSFDMFL